MSIIPYARQNLSDEDIESVLDVLRSDYLTQGPKVPEFEQLLAEKVNAEHAVATNSATSALHIACLSLGLSSKDYLWTSANTFVASANCGLYCGAHIDFVDIDPETWNLSIPALELKLLQAEKENRLPKVLVAVDFAGQPVEQEMIKNLSNRFRFKVIEDASHALGASRNNRKVGSGCWADITVFSFHPVKIITTGEGGMAVTNNENYAQHMRLLRSHGITRDSELLFEQSQGPWYYEQQMLGFNYRMTDIQAALGINQLHRIDSFIANRIELANRYLELLDSAPLQLPFVQKENNSAWHLFVILFEKPSKHRMVFDYLRNSNIGVNLHYRPVYLQPYYQKMGFNHGYCPVAEDYANRAISLPIFPTLTFENQQFVIDKINQII